MAFESTRTPLMAVILRWRGIWERKRRGALRELARRTLSLSIPTSMACSLTAVVVFCFAIRQRGAFTNMILRTRTSVPLDCTWARLVWSARGRALRRLRCGRHKSFCRWRGAGGSRGASKAEEGGGWGFNRGWEGRKALLRRFRRNLDKK